MAHRMMTGMAALMLSVLLVAAGFLVCVLPPTTDALARHLSDDVTSPFSREQLVRIAGATRDYAFGSHDRDALYREILQVNRELYQERRDDLASMPPGFPRLDAIDDPADAEQLETIFTDASEVYVFSPDTVSHLNDCYVIACGAYALVAVLAAVICVGGWHARGHRRTIGSVLRAAGIMVLVSFVALGAFAMVDFQRFFTMFHGVFFSQGNWQFPYDSLLICALPTPFWEAMGVVWLSVSVIACVACIAVGTWLRRRPPRS